MIDGKKNQEILDLFDTYRKLHKEIYLIRFMLFAGIGTKVRGQSAKGKLRAQVDNLLKHHLSSRGLVRKQLGQDCETPQDVIYEPMRAQPPSPRPPAIKIWRDPSLATWTPAEGEARRRQELRRKAEMQTAREQEMAEERESVRGMR